jgi:hypothetical protein
MNLPDFSKDAGLNGLLEQMGAKLISWKSGGNWNSININEILVPTGLPISLDKIKPAKDGTLEYEGQRLIVYIRDQNKPVPLDPDKLRKFHVANCFTLEEMREKGLVKKYVHTTRTDGMFDVNFIEGGKLIEVCVECKLYVCMNCLFKLDYKEPRESFDLKEFLATYGSQIIITPEHDDMTAPVNEYPSDWNQISQFYRKKVGWKCEKCGIHLGEEKRFLHVHHINGLKYESRDDNLRALCIGCHAEQFQHQHMKAHQDYKDFQHWRASLNSTNP